MKTDINFKGKNATSEIFFFNCDMYVHEQKHDAYVM